MRTRQWRCDFYLDDRVGSRLVREYQVDRIPRYEQMLDSSAAHVGEADHVGMLSYRRFQLFMILHPAGVSAARCKAVF